MDGVATIPLDHIAEGKHVFILNITGMMLKVITVVSKMNSPGFSASTSSSEIIVGNSIVVKFSGLKSNESVNIYR